MSFRTCEHCGRSTKAWTRLRDGTVLCEACDQLIDPTGQNAMGRPDIKKRV